ncbi:YycH family regulatory protein [Brevibacillus massiliensis]|jgi:regulatory protein YycH of two-component signal transduction system YycFG|uniref:YycH family regulatory protein n=1 Tax=Brevibacillus massiliensis TaxID=1118054 RepID=UPI0002D69D07|nr:two-component system activity regulator YycH [Brevibacillus massiliensis]
MRQVTESGKTVILCILVAVSFLLTFQLWNKQPQFEFIAPTTYLESGLIGESKDMEDLVTPSAVVFHYGENRHTKAGPTDAPYASIQSQLGKWYFYDFLTYPLTKQKWESLAQVKPGLEIDFRSGIPVSIISQMFAFRGEMSNRMKGIDRIWLYYEESEDMVYALFISKDDKQVVRARTVVSPKDLTESYLPMGRFMPEQILKYMPEEPARNTVFWQIYYVPKEQQKIRQFRFHYSLLNEKAIIDAFFLDPSLIRKIVERDNTVIYTDGSRSLQLRKEQQLMTFTDPALPQKTEGLSDEDKLLGAISFINQHLGWTGTYYFDRLEQRLGEGDVISFRRYVGSYPLVSNDGRETISVTTEEGQIVTMKRSLIDLENYVDYKESTIISGPTLYERLRAQKVDTDQIQNVYLGYQSRVFPEYVELTPVWAVEMQDGTTLIQDARAKNPEEEESQWTGAEPKAS